MRTDRAYTASDGPSFSIKIKIFAALIIIITTVIAVNALFIGHIDGNKRYYSKYCGTNEFIVDECGN